MAKPIVKSDKDGNEWTSVDGENWSPVESKQEPEIKMDRDGKYWASTDGVHWTETEAPPEPEPEGDPVPEAGGMTLRPFGIDTGVEMPEFLAETLIGAGRTFDKIGAGTADLADIAMGKMGVDTGQSMADRKEDQAQKDKGYLPLAEENPWSTGVGEALPYMATMFAPGSLGGIAAQGSKTAANMGIRYGWKQTAAQLAKVAAREAAVGAVEGATHYDESALGGAAWGAGGGLAGKFVGDLFGGTKSVLNEPSKKIIKFAKKHNLYAPSGMSTGVPKLQQMDNALKTHGSTAENVHKARMYGKYNENRMISKEMGGAPAELLSDDYMEDQFKRIGKDMNKLVHDTQGSFNNSMVHKANTINRNLKKATSDRTVPKALRYHQQKIRKMAESGRGIDGVEYEVITKDLNEMASKAFKDGDSTLGRSFRSMSDVYSDAVEEGLGDANGKAWKKSRRQFALAKAIEDAKAHTRTKGFAGVQGYVDADKLAKNFKSSDVINQLGDYEKLRKSQPSSSLSTSGLLARMINVTSPSDSIGAAGLLTANGLGKIGIPNGLIVDAYLKGWPHATGVLPFLGENTQPILERAVARGNFGPSGGEGQEEESWLQKFMGSN